VPFITSFLLVLAGLTEGFGSLNEIHSSWTLGKGGWKFSLLSSKIDIGPWGWLGEKGKEAFISADFGTGFLYNFDENIALSLHIPFKWDQSIGSEKRFPYERSISDPVFGLILSRKMENSLGFGIEGFLIPPLFKRFESPLRKFSTGTWNFGGILLLDYIPDLKFSLHLNLGAYNWDFDSEHGAGSDQVGLGAGINLHYGNLHPFFELYYRWFIFQDIIYHQSRKIYGGSPLKFSFGCWGKINEFLKWNASLGFYLTRRQIDGAPPESLSVLPSRDISTSLSFGIYIERRKRALPFELGEWKLYVSDDKTGKPLFAEVEVEPGGKILSTNRDGLLILKELVPDLYTLRIRSEGYEPQIAYLMVKPGEKGEIKVKLKRALKRGILLLNVKDFITDEYIPVSISISGTGEKVEARGKATLKLLPGTWEIVLESPGYRKATFKVEIVEEVEKTMDIPLLPAGEEFFLFSIQYDYRSTVIQPQYFPLLEKIAKLMKLYPDIKMEISGHTCQEGTPKFSNLLSERRAEVLRDYFLEIFNIPIERIEIKGYGDRRPVAPTKTASGRLKNRRADLKLYFE
jgi:outer membrane protein OmpA-like peptidoglycan-associated protein